MASYSPHISPATGYGNPTDSRPPPPPPSQSYGIPAQHSPQPTPWPSTSYPVHASGSGHQNPYSSAGGHGIAHGYGTPQPSVHYYNPPSTPEGTMHTSYQPGTPSYDARSQYQPQQQPSILAQFSYQPQQSYQQLAPSPQPAYQGQEIPARGPLPGDHSYGFQPASVRRRPVPASHQPQGQSLPQHPLPQSSPQPSPQQQQQQQQLYQSTSPSLPPRPTLFAPPPAQAQSTKTGKKASMFRSFVSSKKGKTIMGVGGLLVAGLAGAEVGDMTGIFDGGGGDLSGAGDGGGSSELSGNGGDMEETAAASEDLYVSDARFGMEDRGQTAALALI